MFATASSVKGVELWDSRFPLRLDIDYRDLNINSTNLIICCGKNLKEHSTQKNKISVKLSPKLKLTICVFLKVFETI